MSIINLPTEIYNLISEFANTQINTKWVKTKKELRVKTITYKCGICKRNRQYRQMKIIDVYHTYIKDICKNAHNCESNTLNWEKKLYRYSDVIDINRLVNMYGYNYENEVKKKRNIRQLQLVLGDSRYSDKDGYVYHKILLSKKFYIDYRVYQNLPDKRLARLSKLVDVVRNIEGNELIGRGYRWV